MHDQARVVIIGSGIAGSSIAYHLTQRGFYDIVVLEQGPLIGGTTSHAPGLVGQLRSSVSLTKIAEINAEYNRRVEEYNWRLNEEETSVLAGMPMGPQECITPTDVSPVATPHAKTEKP